MASNCVLDVFCPKHLKFGSGPPSRCEEPSDPFNLPKSPIEKWLTKEVYYDLFPKANIGHGPHVCSPYSYEAFVIAARYFPKFGGESPDNGYDSRQNARRDLAAFFAHAVQVSRRLLATSALDTAQSVKQPLGAVAVIPRLELIQLSGDRGERRLALRLAEDEGRGGRVLLPGGGSSTGSRAAPPPRSCPGTHLDTLLRMGSSASLPASIVPLELSWTIGESRHLYYMFVCMYLRLMLKSFCCVIDSWDGSRFPCNQEKVTSSTSGSSSTRRRSRNKNGRRTKKTKKNKRTQEFHKGCYFGRGAIQISYNYNYGQFQRWLAEHRIVVDLLQDPNAVMTKKDPPLAILASLWFYMTPQPPKPAMHDIVMGTWEPGPENREAGYEGPHLRSHLPCHQQRVRR